MEDCMAQKSGRQYKDTLFRTLFQNSKNFLELYNAVADEHFPDDTIVTLYPSNNILAKFNDLAAGIGDQLNQWRRHLLSNHARRNYSFSQAAESRIRDTDVSSFSRIKAALSHLISYYKILRAPAPF